MNTLIICTNDEKINILEKLNKNKELHNYKFMDINEFKSNYFFSYDYRAISYLYNKYKYDVDVSKEYIESLYTIDENKEYEEDKLIFLSNLKRELIENNLLEFNNYFKKYISDKKIIVIDYPIIEKYMDDLFKKLNAEVRRPARKEKNLSYYKFREIDDEVEFVAQQICTLKEKGVSLNNIYLVNYDNNYYLPIRNIFKLYNINVDLKETVNLNSYSFVNNYLENDELPKINENNSKILKKFINKVNSISYLDKDESYEKILRSIIKDVDIRDKYTESVKICNLFDRSFTSKDYVFLLGFNYGSIPKTYKDDMFINDSIKENLYNTTYKNEREKKYAINYITNIPNIYISLKEATYKDKFYDSPLIKELNMNKEKYTNNLELSNKANERRFNKEIDNLYRYNIYDKELDILSNNYSQIYNTYSHDYKKICENQFNKYVNEIKLSYTSMNAYNSCPFEYYVNYILKVNPFEETFASIIGNLFHYILEHSYDDNFDIDCIFNEGLKKYTLDTKDRFFLKKLKRIIKDEIEIIKENDSYTMFHNRMFEKKITLLYKESLPKLIFEGKIDKILYHKELNKTYFDVIDYKTGSFDPNLYYMRYGLSSQLATYLYLIIKGNIFESPIFNGMYFESVIMNDKKEENKDYKEELRDNLKYQGYSVNDKEEVYMFDKTYENSKLIKGMSIKKDGSFGRYARVLNEDEVKNLYKYTEDLVHNTFKNILLRDFKISPVRIGKKVDACNKCNYKDICYKEEKDYRILQDIQNLDFLGGEEDGTN